MKRLSLLLCLVMLASGVATRVHAQACTIGGHDETSENFAPGGWSITGATPGVGPAGLPVGHLVISEVAPRGFGTGAVSDSSEYVEIYNPTSRPVSLDNKYLSDDIGYYKVVNGPYPAGNTSDWAGRFPAGLTLSPGRTAIVCVSKTGFAASGASAPMAQYILEMRDTNGNAADNMTIITTGSSFPLTGGLMTNPSATNGEWLVLYCWDGTSDLVCDIDYASWGGNSASNPKMNKTGISIDGPDADLVPSTYNADTGAAIQTNLGAGTALTKPNTYQRVGGGEAAETTSGGNGCLGQVAPTVVDWLPVAGTNHIRFHIRWENPDDDAPTSPVAGSIHSQDFGVFQPDFGLIGNFNVPALSPASFFDVFFEVPITALPSPPQKVLPGGGPGSPGLLKPESTPIVTVTDCPADTNWAGNVDITWFGTGQSGQVGRHYGDLLTCAGGPPSYIHFKGSNCASPMPWTISGVCPGFSVNLVNEDFTPAPNPVPVGWTGWICASAAAGVPSGTNCCFATTFICDGVASTIDICTTACDWSNDRPMLTAIDWVNVGSIVRFHLNWHNESTTKPTVPANGSLTSQAFGVFQPNFGPIGPFTVPPIAPGSFFDVFVEVPLANLPPEPAKDLPGGGPPPGSACPPSQAWNGNVDVVWTDPEGPGHAQKHQGDLLVNLGSTPAYIHVGFTNCSSPMPWQINGLCPGFSATLVNEDRSPASNAVPPGWSGWICVSANASVPSNTTCCIQVKFICNSNPGIIDLCATSCSWNVSDVAPIPDRAGFGIFRAAPNPTTAGTVIDFAIPKSGPVHVEVFDLAGRKVRTILDGSMEAGTHTVRWDGLGENGSALAPGAYFIKLSADGRTSRRKVMLIQ